MVRVSHAPEITKRRVVKFKLGLLTLAHEKKYCSLTGEIADQMKSPFGSYEKSLKKPLAANVRLPGITLVMTRARPDA